MIRDYIGGKLENSLGFLYIDNDSTLIGFPGAMVGTARMRQRMRSSNDLF